MGRCTSLPLPIWLLAPIQAPPQLPTELQARARPGAQALIGILSPHTMGTDHAHRTTSVSPTGLLPPDKAIMALQSNPELHALLSLLPSEQDMFTLASDLKTALRQDLQVVQSDGTALKIEG